MDVSPTCLYERVMGRAIAFKTGKKINQLEMLYALAF
jgi:hypothetical protein